MTVKETKAGAGSPASAFCFCRIISLLENAVIRHCCGAHLWCKMAGRARAKSRRSGSLRHCRHSARINPGWFRKTGEGLVTGRFFSLA